MRSQMKRDAGDRGIPRAGYSLPGLCPQRGCAEFRMQAPTNRDHLPNVAKSLALVTNQLWMTRGRGAVLPTRRQRDRDSVCFVDLTPVPMDATPSHPSIESICHRGVPSDPRGSPRDIRPSMPNAKGLWCPSQACTSLSIVLVRWPPNQ